MALCLGAPDHGYYMSRDPFGAEGDFITAPEVSQVFGELIGVWCAGAWAAMGQPAAFNLVELGPGRGTLMADMLRTLARAAPAMRAAAAVHLVDMSPVLRSLQARTLGQAGATWHESLDSLPDGPTILVANEFFDAIPIRQFERRDGRWHERVIGLREDKLVLGLAMADLGGQGSDGDVIEFAPARSDIARAIGSRLRQHPGAALIIDYGHAQTAPGDTLQAMRQHRQVSILETPGATDLTSHVDFEALAKALAAEGAAVYPLLSQRAFLLAMGIEQRFAMLSARADATTKAVLARQMTRLAAADQMGNLFKILAATSAGLATPYPFGRQ
ncbi:MAG: SAM-dependent methyltransferase [Alphaproteobacteria bacterium]|nr:SAM-dependent methyltransferase [Alphaproteobacteria bacterium]